MSSGTFERLMRTIRKMEPGTMGGQSRVATPVADIIQVASSSVVLPAPVPPTPVPGSELLFSADVAYFGTIGHGVGRPIDLAITFALSGFALVAGSPWLVDLPVGAFIDYVDVTASWSPADPGLGVGVSMDGSIRRTSDSLTLLASSTVTSSAGQSSLALVESDWASGVTLLDAARFSFGLANSMGATLTVTGGSVAAYGTPP